MTEYLFEVQMELIVFLRSALFTALQWWEERDNPTCWILSLISFLWCFWTPMVFVQLICAFGIVTEAGLRVGAKTPKCTINLLCSIYIFRVFFPGKNSSCYSNGWLCCQVPSVAAKKYEQHFLQHNILCREWNGPSVLQSKMDPLVMLHVPLHADLMSGFAHSCLWVSQRSLANVTNLRSLICERSVGSLSPFTVGLCRNTSHEVFSLKTSSFMVIYYSLISNVYATHCLSEDQFFRADTTEGSLHLWDCILEPVRSTMNHWLGLCWRVTKNHLCWKLLHLRFSH